jgi:hypothetical protein
MGGLGSRDPRRSVYLAVFPVGPFDPGLGVKSQDQGRDEKEKRVIRKEHSLSSGNDNLFILLQAGGKGNIGLTPSGV